MDYLRALRTISYILVLILPSITFAEHDVQRSMENQSISIAGEQHVWDGLISDKLKSSGYPFAPFVYGYTQKVMAQADKMIEAVGRHDNSVLFARVNIDNGIFQVIYLAWDDSAEIIHLVRIDSENGRPLSHVRNKTQMPIISELKKLASRGNLIHTPEKNVLGGTSVYLTVKLRDATSRFAVYSPRLGIRITGSEDALEKFTRYFANK
jgi:hypothetical protein